MKKIIFLLFCILFFTGCDVTYNINLDSFDENTSVVCGNFVSSSIITDGMTESELYDYYLVKEVPYYYDQMVFSETNVKFDGVPYYEVSNLSGNGQTGLVFDAHFKDYSNYAKSRLLWNAASDKKVEKVNDILNIYASKIKLFEEYKNVDSLTVNVTSKYRVISNNADKVSGNVYTWVIDRDNYDSKVIKISFNTGTVLDDAIKGVRDDSMVKFTVILVLMIIFGYFIYVFVRLRYKKSNSL